MALKPTTNGYFFVPKIGGDMAVVRGMVKVLIDLRRSRPATRQSRFDTISINEHTTRF